MSLLSNLSHESSKNYTYLLSLGLSSLNKQSQCYVIIVLMQLFIDHWC